MKLKESELKQMIKEALLREMSLSRLDAAGERAGEIGTITTDRDILTISMLEEFLGNCGEKGARALQALNNIMSYVERVSDRNDNISSSSNSSMGDARKGMMMKIAGMVQPNRFGFRGDFDTANKEFWAKFGQAAGEGEYGYISPEEAQQRFNLTDDERYAYEKFIQ